MMIDSAPGLPALSIEPPVTRRQHALRADIQGLRAVAVSLVVVYHLWPTRLTGGFVGVDVFFVISGFLITSHLYSRPPRGLADLAAFWSRRARRLLPAAVLVLVSTLAATRLVAPDTQWGPTAREVIAAALYVQNWQLARTSVDYLAAENAPSPVQHFWSLSVEEQFYLLWPVLMAALVALAWRRGWRRAVVVSAGLGCVVLVSLIWSVHATATEPASAYFITPTRVWELGCGALLARAVRRTTGQALPRVHSASLRTGLAWCGLAAILTAALCYSGDTAFPGWRAALPVVGAAAVIAAFAGPGTLSPTRLLALRPVQALGDCSYSVYLWHWPLIVLVGYLSGGHLGRLDKAGILILSGVLAWCSKRFVEDPFRARGRAGSRKPLAWAAVGMATVVVLGLVQSAEVAWRDGQAQAELEAAVHQHGGCFGAAALGDPERHCAATLHGPFVPAPAQAVNDKSEAYAKDCFASAPFDSVKRCTFGDPHARVSIALVGNSHAGHWLPALQAVAEKRGWRITTFLASECTADKTAVVWDSIDKQRGCLSWADKVLALTTSEHFDLVVTSERNGRAAVGKSYVDSYADWLAGYRQVIAGWARAGSNVLVIHDTATPGATLRSVPDCLAQHPDKISVCAGPRRLWVPRDPLAQAAREAHREDISVVDLNDHLCDRVTCPPVVGGVTVYSDASHMTKTFASSLAPYLAPALVDAVARRTKG
jgi:peptidoglycan/LPS O-acetylase OafA/YrhL